MLNVEANVEVDSTGLGAMEDLRAELADRGVVFALARVKQDLLTALNAYGLIEAIESDRAFPPCPPPSPRTGTGSAPELTESAAL